MQNVTGLRTIVRSEYAAREAARKAAVKRQAVTAMHRMHAAARPASTPVERLNQNLLSVPVWHDIELDCL